MENSRIEEANADAITSKVHTMHDIPAVCHDSESHLTHNISTILKVALEKVNLAVVLNRVFRAKSLERDAVFGNLHRNLMGFCFFFGVPGDLQGRELLYAICVF